tara:strand:+ start:360 stop:569 length:210 start_codon:yes stop_codon:yes gene_type:complete
MKTKKIQMGYYQITINNNIYTVEQNFDLFDNGWQIEIDDEIIDIASTLKQAKQVIQEVENKQKGNNEKK